MEFSFSHNDDILRLLIIARMINYVNSERAARCRRFSTVGQNDLKQVEKLAKGINTKHIFEGYI